MYIYFILENSKFIINIEETSMISKIVECFVCGGNDLIEGTQKGYAAIQGEGLLCTCPLKHTICRSCGTVIRSYVDNPEALLKFNKRKEKDI